MNLRFNFLERQKCFESKFSRWSRILLYSNSPFNLFLKQLYFGHTFRQSFEDSFIIFGIWQFLLQFLIEFLFGQIEICIWIFRANLKILIRFWRCILDRRLMPTNPPNNQKLKTFPILIYYLLQYGIMIIYDQIYLTKTADPDRMIRDAP